MPFRRSMRRFRRPMRAPIVSFKHQRSQNVTYIGAVANENINLYTGGAPGSTVGVQTVPAGNKVYSVDVSLNFTLVEGSGTSTLSWSLIHFRSDQAVDTLFAPTDASNWSNIGLSNGRNQIVKSYMSLIGSEDSGPRAWNLHIKIPKQWHRVREGDVLLIIFNAVEPGSLSVGTRFKSYS